ncbi:MAG: ABC transporter ATP-binding protein [SAR324 cluster bacterium]|nr:ABC transporter ATP-binding protein [SAR324 cluster bacterium]
MTQQPLLELHGITKRFGDALASDHIDFNLYPGEIHVLLGENGAGKSTLMNIIYGLSTPDAGNIILKGNSVKIKQPRDAIGYGINMVHQHFMLIPVFTVAENIMLGHETRWGFSLDKKKASQEIQQLSQDYGLEVEMDALVENLPVGLQQRVEIMKALYRETKILILDEPTAVLTPREVEDLFRVMRNLTEKGISIILITHKLKEVMTIADRITVMRAGRVVGTTSPSKSSEEELAVMMVGRKVVLQIRKKPLQAKDVLLDVKEFTVSDDQQMEVLHQVSFQVRAGEIFGIAGVQGNGQTELALALAGLLPFNRGRVCLAGKVMPSLHPRVLMNHGWAHIPEDRQKHGLVLPYSVADNQILNTYHQPPFSSLLRRNKEVILVNSTRLIEQYDIRTSGPRNPVSELSGGNQQKVIISRELDRKICCLLANQPTRGLDVGSIEYIHQQIVRLRDQGVAVLLISSELDEIISLSDTIAVMYCGKIAASAPSDHWTKEQLGLMMAGYSPPPKSLTWGNRKLL